MKNGFPGKAPASYSLLFNGDLHPNSSTLLSHPPFLSEFDTVLKSWWDGESINLALVGPQGTGKTTQLYLWAEGVPQPQEVYLLRPMERINGEASLWNYLAQGMDLVNEPTSLEEAQKLIANNSRCIIFLDDAQYLWLRVMGGLEALRHLLLLVEATTPHCLWVLAFNQVCWQRLDFLLKISRHFSHIWRTPFFTETEIRLALEKRHAQSNSKLFFSEEIIPGRSSSQDERRDFFYKKINETSAGNMAAAVALWRNSAAWDHKAESVVMSAPPAPKQKLPEWLDPKTRCALAEILSHGGMTAKEISACFLWLEDEVIAFLAPLVRHNFLEVTQQNSYRINPIYIPLVQDALSQAGLLPGVAK